MIVIDHSYYQSMKTIFDWIKILNLVQSYLYPISQVSTDRTCNNRADNCGNLRFQQNFFYIQNKTSKKLYPTVVNKSIDDDDCLIFICICIYIYIYICSNAELSESYSLIFRSEKSMYYQWEYRLVFFFFFSLSFTLGGHCLYVCFYVHAQR
jgi:hypothetical protein